MKPEYH